ncbi:hypothetical protein EJ02DRAFT_109765 [Clathrospora elynae]|uniref:Uncharacterized protein n=1 Tax=Clathrospora elynae TaxID=706981 RepID=A0A6A5SU15_9PLEO|nr:hypothetical protein EJ02DRAFT_109765 [Clathrospora elynae]
MLSMSRSRIPACALDVCPPCISYRHMISSMEALVGQKSWFQTDGDLVLVSAALTGGTRHWPAVAFPHLKLNRSAFQQQRNKSHSPEIPQAIDNGCRVSATSARGCRLYQRLYLLEAPPLAPVLFPLKRQTPGQTSDQPCPALSSPKPRV